MDSSLILLRFSKVLIYPSSFLFRDPLSIETCSPPVPSDKTYRYQNGARRTANGRLVGECKLDGGYIVRCAQSDFNLTQESRQDIFRRVRAVGKTRISKDNEYN